jgi:predicted CXXCH cytochrome family protein
MNTFLALSVFSWASALAQQSVLDTKHNLSLSGPGPFRATRESQVCLFCHVPHATRTDAPLWNRADSRQSYLVYSSSTFEGAAAQPNGSTKLCLSCHDGSLALGAVLSAPSELEMAPGRRFLASGPAFLGTNLRDDHPVSFDYATSRGGTSREFRPPSSIPPPVHLDDGGRVQCTSCHDPHDDSRGDFLLASDRFSLLCTACHQPDEWTRAAHASSSATWNGTGTDPWPKARYATVAENACANCHTEHGGGAAERLLLFAAEEDNCLACHNRNVARTNLLADLAKPSAHTPFSTLGVHDPLEDPLAMTRHAECVDCHDPHAARAGDAPPPGVPGPIVNASGLDGAGQVVSAIRFGFELCYKCHADNNGSPGLIPRLVVQSNTRLEFDPANPSFHPVEAAGANPDVPSLLPPWTTASRVACTDCHASDAAPKFGGTGTNGPHGSVFDPLLGARYETRDNTSESAAAYALCYRCHSRDSILANQSFSLHRKHIVEERAPCSACHDAHGIALSQVGASDHTHLINFDVSIVQRGPSNRLEFQDRGSRRGSCTLRCHGETHSDESY